MSAEKRESGFKTKNYIAAMEWAAFDFRRLSLTRTSFSVIPAALSPKIAETSGRGTSPQLISIGAMEDDASARARIGTYWAAVPDAYADVFTTQNELWSLSEGRAGWVEYWSAAFVSYVMCEAGFTSAQFLRAASHREYIEAAIRARKVSDCDCADSNCAECRRAERDRQQPRDGKRFEFF